MIRINLLKPLQPHAQPLILEEPGNRRKNRVLIGGGLAIVVLAAAALLQYPSLLGGLLSGSKQADTHMAAPIPKPEAVEIPKPKPVTAKAVEETVRDVGDQSERQATQPSYSELVPSEKIEIQYYACAHIFKDIKAVTPPDVGFANFIFTPPGDFYVHGLASNAESYQKFKQGLTGMAYAEVRAGLDTAAGAKGMAREFSFFGTIKYPMNTIPTPPNHVIPKAKLQEELARMKTTAASLGIRLREPKLLNTVDMGDSKRLLYQVKADCSFQQMQDLISDMHQAKSNLGFIKFDLHALGDEQVVAEMSVLAYVN